MEDWTCRLKSKHKGVEITEMKNFTLASISYTSSNFMQTKGRISININDEIIQSENYVEIK